jgi:hypothetical protein
LVLAGTTAKVVKIEKILPKGTTANRNQLTGTSASLPSCAGKLTNRQVLSSSDEPLETGAQRVSAGTHRPWHVRPHHEDAFDTKEEGTMRRSILRWAMTMAALMMPAWVMASDQETAQQIADALRGSGRLVDYSIGVKYEDGTAYLLGRVANNSQANEAVEMAKQMPMVNRVVNNLEIKSTSSTEQQPAQASDTGATSSVKNFFSGKKLSSAQPSAPTDPLAEHADTSRLAPEPEPARGEQAAASRMAQFGNQVKGMFSFGSKPQPKAQPQNKFEGQLTAFEDAEPGPSRTGARPVSSSQNVQRAPQRVAQMPNAVPRGNNAPTPVGAPRPMTRVAMNNNGGQMAPIQGASGGPTPAMAAGYNTPAYDQPHLPNHAWPSYASYPNYAAVTYPKQYSPTAWPYIGPFYPYPQVPLGWRKVTLEWDDGWWFLDFNNRRDRRRH